jgi:hypothetical protein
MGLRGRLPAVQLSFSLVGTAVFFVSTSVAQQNGAVVQGRVEYSDHTPVIGSIRIDGPAKPGKSEAQGVSRFLRDGEFSFDFAPFQWTGGEKIHISVKDALFEDLKVTNPPNGDDYAPKPPMSGVVWQVARPVARQGERTELSSDLTGKYIAWVIVQQSPQEVASSCDPSPRLYLNAEATFMLSPQIIEESLEKWSTDNPKDGAHWSPNADLQTRCRGWRSGQIVALNRKLQTDANLLQTVKDVTPAEHLQPLYLETAKTNTALGAISIEVQDYDAAQKYLKDALLELDHAGPGSTETKKQAKILYDKVQVAKAN